MENKLDGPNRPPLPGLAVIVAMTAIAVWAIDPSWPTGLYLWTPASAAEPAGSAEAAHPAELPDAAFGNSGEAQRRQQLEALAESARWDPDQEHRSEAIHALGLRRDNDAIAVLIEVALDDPEASIRYKAVQGLWHAAADGADEDSGAREVLEWVRDDLDAAVAELARRALHDLSALDFRQAGTQ